MKYPKRVSQHISETASFKLFSSNIPNSWIIRDVTERDYGIDCYLELVNENGDLKGELALIQLKSRQSIPWTTQEYFTLTGVDISSSNYWYNFAVPVFVFLADIDAQELYFISVDYYIKQNFHEFSKQDKFNYKITKSNKFVGEEGVSSFKFYFYYQYYRKQFENELLFFLTNIQHFQDFQNQHFNLDFHLGIEDTDLIYFEAMHKNIEFLCFYLNIDNPIPTLREIKRKSVDKFGNEYHYELYEHDLTECMPNFKRLTQEIIKLLKDYLDREINYWSIVNPSIFRYINNIRED